MTKKFLSTVMAFSLVIAISTGLLIYAKENIEGEVQGERSEITEQVIAKCNNNGGKADLQTQICTFTNGKKCNLTDYYYGNCTK